MHNVMNTCLCFKFLKFTHTVLYRYSTSFNVVEIMRASFCGTFMYVQSWCTNETLVLRVQIIPNQKSCGAYAMRPCTSNILRFKGFSLSSAITGRHNRWPMIQSTPRNVCTVCVGVESVASVTREQIRARASRGSKVARTILLLRAFLNQHGWSEGYASVDVWCHSNRKHTNTRTHHDPRFRNNKSYYSTSLTRMQVQKNAQLSKIGTLKHNCQAP